MVHLLQPYRPPRLRLHLHLHLHLRPAYLVVLLPLLKSAVLTVLLPARPALPE